MRIERISYKHGMLNKPSQRKKLKTKYLAGSQISDEILKMIHEENILSLTGTLGEKEGALPTEYEEVRIKTNDRETKFEIYNKGMSMFSNETPELKRAFKFCVKLQNEMQL